VGGKRWRGSALGVVFGARGWQTVGTHAANGELGAQIQQCTGPTKVIRRVNGSRYWNKFYLNSCDTTAVILSLSFAAGVAGTIAIVAPKRHLSPESPHQSC
jgi:hypothetical protein